MNISVDFGLTFSKLYPVSVIIPDKTHIPTYLDSINEWACIYKSKSNSAMIIRKMVKDMKNVPELNGYANYHDFSNESFITLNIDFKNQEDALLFKLAWEQEKEHT